MEEFSKDLEPIDEKYLDDSLLITMHRGMIKACYHICIVKPSDNLTENQKRCLSMCQDRYNESFKRTFMRAYENTTAGMHKTVSLYDEGPNY